MEKSRLVNFIATVMEDSGFRVEKNYKITNQVIDIYGVLDTSVGEVGVVVACKNYEEPWKIGLDVLKDMEIAAKTLNASKIIVFTTSSFTHGAAVYAQKRNIKLVDRKGILKIAKNYSQRKNIVTEPTVYESDNGEPEYYEPENTKRASLNRHSYSSGRGGSSRTATRSLFSSRLNKSKQRSSSYGGYYQTPAYSSNRQVRRREFNIRDSFIFNFNIDSTLEWFKDHEIVYMLFLLVFSVVVSLLFNVITAGPYTGIGKMLTSAIICFGGMLVVNRNLSDVLFKGFVLFFISLIISIVSLTL